MSSRFPYLMTGFVAGVVNVMKKIPGADMLMPRIVLISIFHGCIVATATDILLDCSNNFKLVVPWMHLYLAYSS